MPTDKDVNNSKEFAENSKIIESAQREINKQTSEQVQDFVRILDLSRGITQELKDAVGIRSRISEQDRGIVNLSRSVTNSITESNRELRRGGRLLSQIQKDRKLQAKIENEIVSLQAGLSDKSREQLSILQAIASTRGIDNELYIEALKNTKTGEESEINKLILLKTQQQNLKTNLTTRKEELKIQGDVNKNLGIAGALTDNLQRIGLRAFGGLGINLGIFEEGIREAQQSAVALAESFTGIDTVLERNRDIIRQNNDSLAETVKNSKKIGDQLLAAAEAQIMSSSRAKEFVKAKEKELKYQEILEKRIAAITQEQLQGNITEIGAKREIESAQKSTNRLIEEQLDIQREIAGEVVDQSKNMTGLQKKTQVLGKLLPGYGKAFMEAMGDPTALLGIAVTLLNRAFKELNEQAVDFQRYTGQALHNLDRSWRRSALKVDMFKVLSQSSRDFSMNMRGVITDEQLAGAAHLMRRMGITAEEAAKLSFLASQQGTSTERIVDSIIDQVNQFNRLNKTAISHRQVLDDISNASTATTASLGLQPGRLSQAAAAARRLGIELSRVENIADSLLNFETSIENELQAQLLTGRNLNLARARELALMNDLEGVGDEIFNHAIGLEEFSRMNRIQQEGIAQALGMSRDELGRIALQRAAENSLTQQALLQAQGLTREEFERQKSMESIQDSIQRIAETFAPVLEMMAKFLDNTVGTHLAMAALATIVGGKLAVGLASAVKSFVVLRNLAASIAIFKGWAAAMSGPKSLLTGGLAGLAIGSIITGAIMASVRQVKDGIISPDGGLLVSGPKGSIQLDPKDSIIAGTSLVPKTPEKRKEPTPSSIKPVPEIKISLSDIKAFEKERSNSISSNQENTALLKKIDELIMAVKEGGDVFMDGSKVGESLALGTYKSS